MGDHPRHVRVRRALTPKGTLTKETNEDLVALKDLIGSGKVTPLIDRTYGSRKVPEALRYFEEGHDQGKVVITP